MTQSSWSLLTLALAMTILPHARAEGETSIWIDEIPLYTQLAACAQDRISAIVRAQSSGCNDDSAHTSFACFCIQQSSKFSSIISTAVAQQCSRLATQVTTSGTVDRRAAHITSVADRRGAVVRQAIATTTGVAENVSSALEVFESYCAKSTDISLFGPTSTNAPATMVVTVTQAPQTITAAPPPTSRARPVTIAAIVVPAIMIALIAIIGALLYVRRNRRKFVQMQTSYASQGKIGKKDTISITELVCEEQKPELQGSVFGNEMGQPVHRAELACETTTARRDGRDGGSD